TAQKKRQQRTSPGDLPEMARRKKQQGLDHYKDLEPGGLRDILEDHQSGPAQRPRGEEAEGIRLQFVPNQCSTGPHTIERQDHEEVKLGQPFVKRPGSAPAPFACLGESLFLLELLERRELSILTFVEHVSRPL